MAEKEKEKIDEKRELEKRIIELNLLNGQLQELEQQLQIIEKEISEFQLTDLALQELKETKQDTEMLASIGQNVFTKAKLQDNKEVFVDLGAKVFAKKTVEEAQDIIAKKIEEFVNVRNNVAGQLNLVAQRMLQIEKEIKIR